MIVADASVLVYLFINGPKTALAHRLLKSDPQWLLPPLWRHEFHNVLVTHVRTGRLSLDQACRAWGQAVGLLENSERPVDMEAALKLAVQHKLSGYDAQYLALAYVEGITCVSEDKALKAKAPAGLVRSMEEMLGQ
jgi:predicted nucleic acid-binding protein